MYLRLHCTVCNCHIGCTPAAAFTMAIHKFLRVLICKDCETFYGSGDFACGDDGSETFCRWCGQGGHLYCCSICPNVFCKVSTMFNFIPFSACGIFWGLMSFRKWLHVVGWMVSDVFIYCSAFEILRTTHSLMQHHIPEDFVAKRHCCENLKSCMSIFFFVCIRTQYTI